MVCEVATLDMQSHRDEVAIDKAEDSAVKLNDVPDIDIDETDSHRQHDNRKYEHYFKLAQLLSLILSLSDQTTKSLPILVDSYLPASKY